MFVFSFIWIALENVSEVISRFWKVSPFSRFYSGMFSVFAILTKYFSKIFSNFVFFRYWLSFSINAMFWSYCKHFSVKKGSQSKGFFFAFLFRFRTRFRCFWYAFRSFASPVSFALFLSLDLAMISVLIKTFCGIYYFLELFVF